MLSRNLYTLLFILFLKTVTIGQVYEGYKEVSPYKKRLAKVDEWLQTDPTRCKSELEYLTKEAKLTNNSTLLGVTYIYQGTAHYYVGFNDSARIYFDKAKRIYSHNISHTSC